MLYQKFSPSKELAPFVECYFVWENDDMPPQPMVVESPPNGFCSIVFNYADPFHITNTKYVKLDVPKQFIAGQSIYTYSLTLPGRIGMAGIVFRPAALASIFGLPMYEFVEERTDLYKIFRKEVVDQYVALIGKGSGPEDRARILEDFLMEQLKVSSPKPDRIDESANQIVELNGMVNISELVKQSFMSRRTFERNFFQKVGLSPKYYVRIRRIAYICNLIAGKKEVDWPRILYDLEYFDQSHFIKDFENFTGRSPGQYLKLNNELVNYLENKPVQQPFSPRE
ncbi:MAG TPA: helix-turn-helix domain-containing protein [Chitinophagaceae bacterium]|nr:helix-turn-helix domain-containing protein [Chitinophagaceae bacterium]